MGTIHFLNVNEGDCTWIHHPSGHFTVIDVSAATSPSVAKLQESKSVLGNYQQKNHPVNPITYMNDFEVSTIFRFILTHPDMDHMDGIKALFDNFDVSNFWDTKNTKIIDDTSWGKYNKEDWEFYQKIRTSKDDLTVLNLYAGSRGKYYNEDENGNSGGDGLYILAPTPELVDEANKSEEYNDCSYVILYKSANGGKILFAGDSAEKTWDYILENHKMDVTDIDILIAPHHGRKTGGNNDYLDVLKPKLTLFGNARSEYLDYNSWNNRGLDHITNNQAGCIIIDAEGTYTHVYVTNETFAKDRFSETFYSERYKAWYLMAIL